jgi:hypothetical protein
MQFWGFYPLPRWGISSGWRAQRAYVQIIVREWLWDIGRCDHVQCGGNSPVKNMGCGDGPPSPMGDFVRGRAQRAYVQIIVRELCRDTGGCDHVPCRRNSPVKIWDPGADPPFPDGGFRPGGERSEPVLSFQQYYVLLECWNDVLLEPWKERVPGSKRLVTRQVKRLVLSGVIPTIQQQRESLSFVLFTHFL